MRSSSKVCIESPVGPLTITTINGKVTEVTFELLEDSADKPSETAMRAAAELNDYFQGNTKSFSVETELIGTDFQKAVWAEIAKIDYGKTVSYSEIAAAIGKPGAARAVGGAVGANPIPIIVPCHRVMGSTGKITGYSGGAGIPTKEFLLKLEGIR
jgi:methylated-DNA-[protein]-cysteine S-methyltransferase